jgi:hypothetical protein
MGEKFWKEMGVMVAVEEPVGCGGWLPAKSDQFLSD